MTTTEPIGAGTIVDLLGPQGIATLAVLAAILLLRNKRARKSTYRAVRRMLAHVGLWLWARRLGIPLRLAGILTRDRWDGMTAARGLPGLTRGKVRRTPFGIAIHVRLTRALTVSAVSSRLEQIETGLGLPASSLRLKPGKRADKAQLIVQLRDPLAALLTWPGAPRDVRKPVPLGLTEYGEPVTLRVTQRTVTAGTSGAGKSSALRIVGATAVLARNARLVYIDPKAVEGALWQGAAIVATKPEQIRAAVARIKAELGERLELMAQRGKVEHEPTEAEPAVIVIVDEGAELKRLGLDDVVTGLTSIAQLGRAAHFWLHWASQYLTDKSGGAPVGIMTQAEAVVGLKVETARINRTVFGDEAEAGGWTAQHLPGGGGWFLLRDVDHRAPVQSKAYFLTADDVRALPRTDQPAPAAAPAVVLTKPTPVEQPEQREPVREPRPEPTVADLVWSVLAQAERPMGVRELARELQRDPATVQRAINKLSTARQVAKGDDRKYTAALAPSEETQP